MALRAGTGKTNRVKILAGQTDRREPLDRAEPGDAQDDGLLGAGERGRDEATLRFILRMRWVMILLELAAVSIARLLGASAPYPALVSLIIAAALFNLAAVRGVAERRTAGEREAAVHLAFNILQGGAMCALTGGVLNPLIALIIAPVGMAGASLRPRQALAIGALAAAVVVAVAIWSLPLPHMIAPEPRLSLVYTVAATTGVLAALITVGGYAWRASTEAKRMELALRVSQAVLAREQRLSALGGLAAAAAHELGTPLATISVVAKELARSAEPGPVLEDAELLVSQAERCREILKRLTETPETDDAVHARMTLLQFANEVIEPHLGTGVRVEAVVNGPPGMRAPDIRRMPEVLHAMTSLVENAVDFAASETLVSVRFDETSVSVEVRDDGPGFAADVLQKLGQPYVTTRSGAEGSRSGHQGLGLGFFIAKTLLERTGAGVTFGNAKSGGAVIAVRWPRTQIEAPILADGFELGVFDLERG